MKIAFMGTPEFAVPALGRLIDSRHEVALVVTQPSKPTGRGRKVTDPPVKTLAETAGLRVIQPKSLIKEPIDEEIRRLGIDVLVVAAYGKILPEALLEAPRIGCLNIHPSILPEYRGAAPIQRAIMDGRLESGVTIMEMAPELDAGPIVAQERVEIYSDDDAQSLGNMLSVLGADMLMRTLDEIEESGRIESEEQDHERATYAEKIRSEEGEIDWTLPSDQIMYRMRALTPWPGLHATFGGRRSQIVQAEPLDSGEAAHHGADDAAKAGVMTAVVPGFGFAVRTGDGHLLVRRLRPEGKGEMEAAAFLNGTPMSIGRPAAEIAKRKTGSKSSK